MAGSVIREKAHGRRGASARRPRPHQPESISRVRPDPRLMPTPSTMRPYGTEAVKPLSRRERAKGGAPSRACGRKPWGGGPRSAGAYETSMRVTSSSGVAPPWAAATSRSRPSRSVAGASGRCSDSSRRAAG